MSHPLPKGELEQADPVFKDAHVLSNSEVALLMQEYVKQRTESTPNFQPPPLVQKTMDYADKFNCGKNAEAVIHLRRIAEQAALEPYEWGLLANLQPETYEEAAKLVPSIEDDPNGPPEEQRHLNAEDIQRLLSEISGLKSMGS